MSEAAAAAPDNVEGERALPSINARKRKSGIGGIGVIVLVLVVLLGGSTAYMWYQKNSQVKSEQAPAKTDQSDTAPPLTFMETPPAPPAPPEYSADGMALDAGDETVPAIETEAETAAPVAAAGPRTVEEAQAQAAVAKPKPSLDKGASTMMLGSRAAGGGDAGGISSSVAEYIQAAGGVSGGSLMGGASAGDSGAMAELLQGTATKPKAAKAMGDRNFLLAKGTALDCGMSGRIDTTVPGVVMCMLTRDVFSDNGKVVLLERGSKVEGEYSTGLTQGQARVFVVWTRVRTPKGVEIALDSPGTDPLGASGLPGKVNNHFWKRFGAAMLVSIVDTGLAVSGANGGNGTTVNLSGATDQAGELATKILETTVNIPPTLYKHHGDRINILVARDLDFGGVYALAAR